jgi:hypothetical protein
MHNVIGKIRYFYKKAVDVNNSVGYILSILSSRRYQ